jgi:hypothetical protein
MTKPRLEPEILRPGGGAFPPFLARPGSRGARYLGVALLVLTIISWLVPDPIPLIDEILLPILAYLALRRGWKPAGTN